MAKRDYETAPVTQELRLNDVIQGLVGDLEDLRAGKISTNDAMARSQLAKQIFNGVRIYMQGAALLSGRAKTVEAIAPNSSDAA